MDFTGQINKEFNFNFIEYMYYVRKIYLNYAACTSKSMTLYPHESFNTKQLIQECFRLWYRNKPIFWM